MKDLNFVPECYIDTNLVEFLLETDGVNHQKGCNNVINTMKGKVLNDSFAVGVIDADKRQPSYVKEFIEIAHTEHISLTKHKEKPHYLIIICPAMDSFILDCAEAQDIDVSEYNLSSDLNTFKKQTKTVVSKSDMRFKRLFKQIKNNLEFSVLFNVLNYLKSHQYKSSQEDLLNLFCL